MSQESKHQAPKRVLSGMRPTGKLHLGNYMGALKNWVELQNATHDDGGPAYDCYFFIADYHALTTDYADTSELPANVREVALDFLAAGLDPKRCTIFVQSKVPAHAELALLLGMITPLSWLERVPSYKDQQEQLKEKDLGTFGFLGYPLLMSADILVYQADFVPWARTRQRMSRSRARSRGGSIIFTAATIREILPEPKVLLTPSPKLPGTDGRKMSKSYGNTILLSDPEPEVRAKLKTMVTDPARIRRTDAGNPDMCPVFDLHKVFSSGETQAEVRAGCTSAGIGCIQCKGWLADAVVKELAANPGAAAALRGASRRGAGDSRRRRGAGQRARRADDAAGARCGGARIAMSEKVMNEGGAESRKETAERAAVDPTLHDGAVKDGAPGPSTADDEAIEEVGETLVLRPGPAVPAEEPKRAGVAAKDAAQRAEDSQSPFSVTVGQVYDGPLDLLLDLIRKQNIDIYDIPIAKITAQFLAYVHQLKQTDVDVAGEFIYTASLLIHIK